MNKFYVIISYGHNKERKFAVQEEGRKAIEEAFMNGTKLKISTSKDDIHINMEFVQEIIITDVSDSITPNLKDDEVYRLL